MWKVHSICKLMEKTVSYMLVEPVFVLLTAVSLSPRSCCRHTVVLNKYIFSKTINLNAKLSTLF